MFTYHHYVILGSTLLLSIVCSGLDVKMPRNACSEAWAQASEKPHPPKNRGSLPFRPTRRPGSPPGALARIALGAAKS